MFADINTDWFETVLNIFINFFCTSTYFSTPLLHTFTDFSFGTYTALRKHFLSTVFAFPIKKHV